MRSRLVAAVAAFGVFGAVALGMAFGAWDGLDGWMATALARRADPGLTAFMAAVSAWHAPLAIVALTALAGAVLLWRRDVAGALILAVTVLGGATLNHLLKHGIQRPRPGVDPMLGALTDYSFPSGHVTNSTLLYGALAALVVSRAPRPCARWAAVCCAIALVLLVSLSRLVLEAHRLSDVLASVPVGLGWLALCLAGAAALRRARP
jgi:membrane-associated phospholipid phosphatase